MKSVLSTTHQQTQKESPKPRNIKQSKDNATINYRSALVNRKSSIPVDSLSSGQISQGKLTATIPGTST